ncbi:MAG: NAD(P)/FAD-dependent oxidoreductase [Desulfobacca sp.]|uniref:NAD(P)/FAD-dependent oxidoreductase n=1 Tax=Desulfobacca sp. TaxID=2067990 RepID=UPI00404AD100
MRAVIIGNSAAGLAGAETLRRLQPLAEITIISDEPYPPYCRPLLTYLLGGEISTEALWLKAKDYYEQWRFQALLGRRVVEVDPTAKTVALDSGESLPYDRLLVASGARPLLPGIPGENLPGVFTIRTLGEFQAMQQMLRPGQRVAVVGSGLVGLKTAQALAQAGFNVTLVARKAQVLSKLLDATAAALLHEALQEIGVALRFHAVPAALAAENGRVAAVVLADGSEIPADLVIFGIGVRPNTEFLAAAGLSDPQGLPVDAQLRIGPADIFAAGDCVRPQDRLTGQPTYFAIWPAAVAQGRLAGANMAGYERTYDGLLAQNTFAVGATRIIAGGLVRAAEPSCEVHLDHDPKHRRYRRLVMQDGRLVGVILVGQVEDAGVYLSLINNKTPLASLPCDPRRATFQVGRLLG